HLAVSSGRYAKAELAPRLLRPALEQIRALPGVQSAGFISALPIQNAWINSDYEVEGAPSLDRKLAPIAEVRITSPGPFAGVGVPFLQGRDLAGGDGASALRPIVVNRALVARHFKDGDVLGRRLILDKTPYTIVGVVGDVRQAGLDQPPLAEIHFPYDDPENGGTTDATLVVRTRADPLSLIAPLREAVRSVTSEQPLYDVLTMDEVISR